MKRCFTKISSLVVVLAVLVGVGAVSPAAAERPAERFTFTDTFSVEDPFFAAACGLENVVVDGVVKVQLNFFEDGSARIHENGMITFTNPESGDQVFLTFVRAIKDASPIESVDGDLLTIVYDTTFNGLPEKWQAPRMGVIVRDAGSLTIRHTLVIDLTIDPEVEDPVVSFTEEIIDENGPHPIANQGFQLNDDEWSQVCSALGGAFEA